jgi:hypothetical protein
MLQLFEFEYLQIRCSDAVGPASRLSPVQEHFSIARNHVIKKASLKIKELTRFSREKADQLFKAEF